MMTVAGWLLPLYVSLLSLLFGNDDAELVFVGDAMQHQGQLDAARNPDKTYDYSQCFEALPECVVTADLAVANLETPMGVPPYSGYPCFNAPPAYARALVDAGFDLLLTANNHTLDRRDRGLRTTIGVLDSIGVPHLGTYANDSARAKALPMIIGVNSFKIAFLNYTYGTNGITPGPGTVVDYIDRTKIMADVKAARDAGAELVAVCMHWGDEYVLLPNKSQRSTADFLEALGVDMIIGGHPHVIQPMEFRPNRYYPEKNVFLVYSLGNFISNMKTPDTRGGALARVRVHRGDDGVARLKDADYRLLFTTPGTSPSRNFRVTDADSVTDPSWRPHARQFMKRAREIFDKHNINVPEATR